MHARRRAALGGGAVMAARIEHLVTSGTFSPRRRHLGRRQQRLARRRRHRGGRHRRRPRRRRDRRGRRRPHAARPSSAPTPTTTTSTPPPRSPTRTGAPILLHPDDLPLWKQTHPDRAPDGELADGQVLDGRRRRADRAAHARPRAGRGLPVRARAWARVFTGDTLFQGGPGATGRSYSRLPDDHRLDPGPAAGPARPTRSSTPATATRPPIGAEAPHLQEWIDRGF